jgi:hypothetical protein
MRSSSLLLLDLFLLGNTAPSRRFGYNPWMQFEWDAVKAAAKLKKHRVSFDEATTVFGILWVPTRKERKDYENRENF